jgi:ArsR family transcriptional regulator
MAQNKKEEFSEDLRTLAEFSKAISHPARIAILQTISEKKECICGEIVDVLPLAQSTVSQHLKDLKEIGLIQGEVEGNKSCYCINWNKLEELNQSFNLFYKKIIKHKKSTKIDCC